MRVVIVGAGLSGLSLAVFLRRLNVDCVVLEQAPFLQANYTIPYTLFANALSCFKAFGMEYIFTNSGMRPEECFGIQNEKGEWLLRIPNRDLHLHALSAEDVIPLSTAPPANSDSIVSQRLMEAQRQEMGHVPLRCTMPASYLRDALRRHIPEIKFSCRVVDLLPHDGIKGGVHAVMEDGATEWGDVVVGADGMHSTIRGLLYPNEHVGTSSRSLNSMQIDGFTECPHCPPHLAQPVECWGAGRTLRVVPLHRFGENTLAFSATLHRLPQELVDVRADMDAIEVLQVFQRLLGREYASFGADVATLLSQAKLAVPTEVLEVPVMPRWYNRRAVLMGEAAHGAMPSFLDQDASLCVEDAALLAVSLLDVPLQRDSGFEYAFRQFETVRRDRVERYIRQSRRARKFTAMSNTAVRNTLLRLVPSVAVNMTQRWLSNWTYSSQQLAVDPKIKMETAFR
ncbi:putative mitochondrial Monooxygenase [Leptomonas pyrrhocoris]|uniref:Putative mitochondrial Monooxygenase n=1 Tax=Leptomonas pyrrhocoris TaxID=157538 RepID=A0A0M9FQK4_LEPPY|nr:putative mitochondrial Monooxygenase [Leptomonas pyrrhocoris]KPA74055.1 putative mitochondrial Monooxygenase [Leptomonas pyrrhocoris]|eukprot:XP_015652494.1 putative mitochondrial Monooxygenase [Leptomonas pyrrhocoris]